MSTHPKGNGNKPGPLEVWALRQIAQGFAVHGSPLTYEAVCGIPNAGEPLAVAFVHSHPMPLLQLLKTEGDGARKIARIVPGHGLINGARILLIDDVITEADTKLEVVSLLREHSFIVEHLLVVVDREQGGVAQLDRIGIQTHALFGVRALIDHYFQTEKIDAAMHTRAIAYLG